jgi:hypothetical protein
MTDRAEVVAAIKQLCQTKYAGDYRAGFVDYATNGGKLDTGDIENVLRDAGIGSWATRWIIAADVLKELDTDGDELVSWDEFQAALAKEPT